MYPSFAMPSRRGALALLGALAACGAASAASDPDRVSLEAARAEHEAGRAILIDIREP